MKIPCLLGWGCVALLLSACSGQDVPAPPTGPSVSGKVLDGVGRPLSGARVFILGNERGPATTDDSGAFGFSGVSFPYDLAIVRGAGTQDVTVYQGLTLQELTLFSPIRYDTLKANLSGTVTQADGTSASGLEPRLVFASPEVRRRFVANASTGGFSSEIAWSGTSTTTGTLYALQPERLVDRAPSHYAGFGRGDDVSLTAGETLSRDIQLHTVDNASLGLQVSVPADYHLSHLTVDVQLQPDTFLNLFDQQLPSSFTYTVPAIPETRLAVHAYAAKGAGPWRAVTVKSGVAPGSQDVVLAFIEAARLLQPEDQVWGLTRDSEFSWAPVQGGVHQLLLQPQMSVGSTYSLTVFTSASQTRLPDLGPLGIHLPGNTSFTWRVVSFAPMTSVDELVEIPWQDMLSGARDVSYSESDSRTLITAISP